MSVNDNNMRHRIKSEHNSHRTRARAQAVFGEWSVDPPGTLVKNILGIDLSKQKISLSEDNVVMIDNLKINDFVNAAYTAISVQLKKYEKELEKIDKLLADPLIKENPHKIVEYEQKKQMIKALMHEWSKSYRPKNANKETQDRVNKNLKSLEEKIQAFNNLKEKDLVKAALKLKEIKVQMLKMSRELNLYTKMPIRNIKDLNVTPHLIGLLIYDAYDYLSTNKTNDKLQEISVQRANTPTRELAYIKYLKFQTNLAIDPSRPDDNKTPKITDSAKYLAYLMINENDTPDVIIARLSLRNSLIFGKPNPILFETATSVLSGREARNAILNIINNRMEAFSLVQILKIFSKIKSSGINMNDIRTSVLHAKDGGANILQAKTSEIKNKAEEYLKLLKEINDKLSIEDNDQNRAILLLKHKSLVGDYLKLQKEVVEALNEKHERMDGKIESSLNYFAYKNKGTDFLADLKKYFNDSKNIDLKHPAEQQHQQDTSKNLNPVSQSEMVTSLTNISSALLSKSIPPNALTMQSPPHSLLTQHNSDRALKMNQSPVSRSALISYDDYKKACLTAEKELSDKQKEENVMYQGVELVKGFTKDQNVDRVIIQSKNIGSALPHKMVSKFIPQSIEARDKNSVIDPQTKGEVEITIDPNPDDKILYQAFVFHTSVQNLKLEPGCNPETILNLVKAASKAKWTIELMKEGQENEWVQDLSATNKNKLGLTQSDYQRIVKFTNEAELAKRVSPEQLKAYKNLIKEIANPTEDKHKGYGIS